MTYTCITYTNARCIGRFSFLIDFLGHLSFRLELLLMIKLRAYVCVRVRLSACVYKHTHTHTTHKSWHRRIRQEKSRSRRPYTIYYYKLAFMTCRVPTIRYLKLKTKMSSGGYPLRVTWFHACVHKRKSFKITLWHNTNGVKREL